jgi:hypothetical protein
VAPGKAKKATATADVTASQATTTVTAPGNKNGKGGKKP